MSISRAEGLNAELNPICHLLALLEAHHILHVSRIRVKTEKKLTHESDLQQRRSVSLKFHMTIHLLHLEVCHTAHFV